MTFWDDRYNRPEYVYGTEPNEFLAEQARHIPRGRVLCLAEGEGRNAVHLAKLGYEVTAVDASAVGIEKTKALAAENGVEVETHVADLADFNIEPNAWRGIVSLFAHVPRPLRAEVHRCCVQGLAPGGMFILEAFTPEQLNYGTGGPRRLDLLMTLTDLKNELDGLEFILARETERELNEGMHHTGPAAVVQVVGKKQG